VADGLAEVEDESFGRCIGRHIGHRLKAGVRGHIDNAALASRGHRSAEVMSEGNKRLHIDLDFSLLLLAVVGKEGPAQTESCIIYEKVYLNTTTFKLLGDFLSAVRIS
jgi:hypothetical protein